MASPFAGPQIDFSALQGIGQSLGEGYQRRKLASEMQGVIGPDGTFDYDKAISVLMQRDPVLGMKLATQKQEADALASYNQNRIGVAQQAAIPDDIQLYNLYKQEYGPGVEPFRLGPSDAGGAKEP